MRQASFQNQQDQNIIWFLVQMIQSKEKHCLDHYLKDEHSIFFYYLWRYSFVSRSLLSINDKIRLVINVCIVVVVVLIYLICLESVSASLGLFLYCIAPGGIPCGGTIPAGGGMLPGCC